MTSTKGGQVKQEQNPLDQFEDAELQELYGWIDSIPLSRPKRNIGRDFSDGVLIAEMIHYYFPKLVELHSYPATMSTVNKEKNWYYLNRKVFSQLSFELGEDVIRDVTTCKPGCVEKILMMLRTKLTRAEYEIKRQKQQKEQGQIQQQRIVGRKESDKPEADQYLYMGSPGRAPPGGNRGMQQKNRNSIEFDFVTQKNISSMMRQPEHISNKKFNQKPSYEIGNEKVSRLLFEEKEQECFAKDETIKILQAKIQRLEHLIHLKDVRIDDLQSRLEAMRPTGHGGKR